MCDTFAYVGTDGTFFAKNSDRPPDEIQLARTWPRREPGSSLRTQYLDLGHDPGAFALPITSQPDWLWGLEHGVNEHLVAIGNEAVYTADDRWAATPALLGMDLVRLTLERCTSADNAVDVLTDLVERHGQGGSGWQNTNEPYFSSFLIADPISAWVVETSQRTWAARRTAAGGLAISNRISLGSDFDRASKNFAPGSDFQVMRDTRAPTPIADHRLAVTSKAVAGDVRVSLESIAATLRDHGPSRPAIPLEIGEDWSGVSVCMHVRGYQSTTASMISWLPAESTERAKYWVALGNPCISIFIPCFNGSIPVELAAPGTWQRFATLRDRVDNDPTGTTELQAIREVLDPLERELWATADGEDPRWPKRSFAAVERALQLLQV